MNLYACDIPRGIANAQIGLFNDPNEVTNEQNKLFGKQVSQVASKTNTKDSANEQNNDITNLEQKDLQNS